MVAAHKTLNNQSGLANPMLTSSSWLLWATSLALLGWLYLILGRGSPWRAESMLDAALPAQKDMPDLVAVVPARNEAAYIGRSLRSLLAQDYPGRLRVILVDDHSEDATRAIAQAVPVPPGRQLEVIDARPLPRGWSGKLWAVSEGLREVARRMPDAPYVLLTDADVEHDPGNLRRLMAKAERDHLDLVSLMVSLHCEYPWERLLSPAYVFFFRQMYPFAAVSRQRSATAAAAGPCMLVRRAALTRAGGIEAIHGCLIDDVSLARRIKNYPTPGAGRIWLGLTGRTHSMRGQAGIGEVWEMVVRYADTQLHHSLGAARAHGHSDARALSGAAARRDRLATARLARRRGARPCRLVVHDPRLLADRSPPWPATVLGLDVAARRGSLHGHDRRFRIAASARQWRPMEGPGRGARIAAALAPRSRCGGPVGFNPKFVFR